VALLESRAARQEVHRMPVTGFLAALAAGELVTAILPDQVVQRSRHQFAPFD
jgi:lauroyl/myristoyl acyltransferase